MRGESLHKRLNEALNALPGRREDNVEALHDFIRERGVRGVHSTRYTLRRWLNGEGTPPDYWLEHAARFLKVKFRWLKSGEGIALSQKTAPAPAPKEKVLVGEGIVEEDEEPEKMTPPVEVKAEPEPPKPPPPSREEGEVSVPSPEDIYASNSKTVQNFLAKTESIPAVKAILKYEPENPEYEGGRVTILRVAKIRLEYLEGLQG